MATMFKSSLLVVAAVVSVVIGVALFFALNPMSASWGASNAPGRQGLLLVETLLILDIPAICGIYMFSKKQEWLAPPGRYVAGERKYSVLSPYFLAACAVMAAVETVIGFTGIGNVDLAALITSFTAVFFGPLVAFVAPFLAYVIRWMLGFSPWITVPAIVAIQGLIDAGIWSICAILFWSVVRRMTGHARTLVSIVFMAVFIAIHATGWLWLNYWVLNPYPASLAATLYAISPPPTGFYLTSILAIIFGVFIGEFYYESRSSAAELARIRGKATTTT